MIKDLLTYHPKCSNNKNHIIHFKVFLMICLETRDRDRERWRERERAGGGGDLFIFFSYSVCVENEDRKYQREIKLDEMDNSNRSFFFPCFSTQTSKGKKMIPFTSSFSISSYNALFFKLPFPRFHAKTYKARTVKSA